MKTHAAVRSPFVLFSVMLALMLVLPTGCADKVQTTDPIDEDLGPADGDEDADPNAPLRESHRSSLPRNTAPSGIGLPDLAEGNHEFTIDFYNHIRQGEGANLLFSPVSIRTAFAMVYAGAGGETEAEIARVLRYSLDQNRVHDAFNALDLALQARNRPADSEYSAVELYMANRFWGRLGLPFEAAYLDLLAVNYGAGIETLDFAADPEACRQIINGWVEEQTRDRIRDLLPPGSLEGDPAAVLANALYLKAPWEDAFPEMMTGDEDFYLLDGTSKRVPMMLGDIYGEYSDGPDYQAAELYYRGGELSMVILLPDRGHFVSFEEDLNAGLLCEILAGLSLKEMCVTMPKFTFESSFKLKSSLWEMGMEVPFRGCPFFDPCADFTAIADIRPYGLYIDEGYHKTFIAVDEKGTEAAAATAIVFGWTTGGSHNPDVQLVVDRPFLFLIRDRATNVILFFGRVLDPTA